MKTKFVHEKETIMGFDRHYVTKTIKTWLPTMFVEVMGRLETHSVSHRLCAWLPVCVYARSGFNYVLPQPTGNDERCFHCQSQVSISNAILLPTYMQIGGITRCAFGCKRAVSSKPMSPRKRSTTRRGFEDQSEPQRRQRQYINFLEISSELCCIVSNCM